MSHRGANLSRVSLPKLSRKGGEAHSHENEFLAMRPPVKASGGQVVRIPLEPGYSTSRLLERIKRTSRMILPIVSELLARVARRSVAEQAFDALRRRGGEVRLAGLTDSAKALLIPLAFAELGGLPFCWWKPISAPKRCSSRCAIFIAR